VTAAAPALAKQLARRIRLGGPITVADYMREALGHPDHGYYATRDPLGADGDFTTAPEVSQMFGELVGLWCLFNWFAAGGPDPFRLVELGPGRGTLMADALRAARLRPPFLEAMRLHLVETSPVLRDRQQETLMPVTAGLEPPQWHDALADVPEGPLLLVANEFFDALPVHQFERSGTGWRERAIDCGADDRLRWCHVPPGAAFALIDPGMHALPPGSIVEVSPTAIALAGEIGRRIARDGGAALIVDYGYARPAGTPSLQAVRGHARHDPLSDPGEADLTAHVDFGALARAAGEAGASVWGPVAQRDLLERLGIRERASQLAADAMPEQAADIEAALARLLDETEMGSLFQAIAITAGDSPPPGFLPAAG
jgi:NADH dehydrogenase [ubiquinone] 1 alpha subcomplex assembly factor 7